MLQLKEKIITITKGKVEETDKLVSKRLRSMRILLGLSQQDLSSAVGVSLQQIQKYEKASNRISSGKLFTFSKILNVPIGYFFDQKISEYNVMDSFTPNKTDSNEKEILALLKSFRAIKNSTSRKQIINLVKSMVSNYI